ncbi:hypothetical protein M3Y97_00407400 [Aphelenchoides bicaudatus]|nr:hypothetical protein M3Y97_00407400 [Aphelenchoides bicaudatus]
METLKTFQWKLKIWALKKQQRNVEKKRLRTEKQVHPRQSPNNVASNNEKDSSPMEEEICSASTSTFMTNVDDDETFTKNNLSIVSPTLTTSGLINEQTLVTAMDLSALSEGREIHLGLMDERTEIGNNPRYPFSFPLFDRASESDVDLLILMALFALRPIEKTNPAYWDNCRGWFLRQIGFAVARARYERGQALSEIFRWFDYVLGAELEAANNCKTENAYIKWALLSIINSKDFIEREFDLNGKITSPNEKSPSHSAPCLCNIFLAILLHSRWHKQQ